MKKKLRKLKMWVIIHLIRALLFIVGKLTELIDEEYKVHVKYNRRPSGRTKTGEPYLRSRYVK